MVMPINSFVNYPMNWRPDKKKLKRPIYQSLLGLLQQDIADGTLRPDTRMPPQRELADYLDINFTTVTRVYKLAQEQGLLYARTGSGTFVSPNASEYISITLGERKREIIDFGLVSSFEESNVLINDAVRHIADRGRIEELTSYDYANGLPYHKQMGIAWLHWLGLETTPGYVTITPGGSNALAMVLISAFEPGSRIAVPQYCFSNFLDLARMLHIHLVPIPEDQNGILPQSLDQVCQMTDVSGIYLMPTGSNPTGSSMSASRREQVIRILKKHHLILLEDDTYAFLSVGQGRGYEKPLTADLPEQSVYICSMSKCLCSGTRIAYIVCPPALKDAVNRAFYNINVKTSSIDAEIISELIRSGKAMEIVEDKRKRIAEAGKIYRDIFPCAPEPENPDCYYRWLPIKGQTDGRKTEKIFLSRGVQIYHSDRFLTGPREAQQYIRISLSSAGSPQVLRKGLERIRDVMEQEAL